MKRNNVWVILLGVIWGVWTAWAGLPQPATDANGDSMELSQPPQRISVTRKAALIPADALFLFPQAQEHIVGLARVDQGLGNFYTLLRPELAGEYSWIQHGSVEEIVARRPDLVITKVGNTEFLAKKLRELGIPCFTVSLETISEWMKEIPQMGRLLGEEERATEVIQHFNNRLDRIDQVVSVIPVEQRPRVLLLNFSAADNHNTFSVSPDSWLQVELVERAGGMPVWKGAGWFGGGWSKVSFEQVAAWDPDYIFVVSYKTSATRFLTDIQNSPHWQKLRAAQQGRILALPADRISYAQPVSRWILCLQWIGATLHPTPFSGFDMETEIRTFYRDFYNLTDPALLDTLLQAYRASMK